MVCQKLGGSEIWDHKDWNNDSRTPVISHYLVPTQVGSSGSYPSPGMHYKTILSKKCRSWVSVVSIATRLQVGWSGVWILVEEQYLLQHIQMGSWACLASYPVGIGFFSGVDVARMWRWPLISVKGQAQEWVLALYALVAWTRKTPPFYD